MRASPAALAALAAAWAAQAAARAAQLAALPANQPSTAPTSAQPLNALNPPNHLPRRRHRLVGFTDAVATFLTHEGGLVEPAEDEEAEGLNMMILGGVAAAIAAIGAY
ncbi:hypothetical protein Dda_1460 [Drechslerella dactyloides]|uniref:Uncharacterized protein n=1 Tax=Drechslerella dactyloides TaxID=74499 RepID=A0AAD6J685_DREDA|nr:hypothetical protein Dda_1460 [Drechslerella dactyloides]